MKILIVLIFSLLFIILDDKYDIRIKKEWNGIYLVWKTVERDPNTGEYHDIRKNKRIIKLTN